MVMFRIRQNIVAMNAQEILNNRLDHDTIDELRKRIGADSNEQTEAATSAVISSLVAALSRNAESTNGREALSSALERDHDGSLLDNAASFLFGNKAPANPRTTNGPGILEHIFGRKQTRVAEGIGRGTGLDKNRILQLMMTLAPLVLGALGKQRRQGNNNILDILRNASATNREQIHDKGLLDRLLDDEDDPGILDDLARLGRNAFLARR